VHQVYVGKMTTYIRVKGQTEDTAEVIEVPLEKVLGSVRGLSPLPLCMEAFFCPVRFAH
jgi:hypothetical protein